MQVDGTSQATQMQMRKMDGTGGGQGNGQGGMKDIMQSLSQEDRNTLKDKMSSMSMDDRKAAMDQMKQVDVSSDATSSGDTLQALLDILDQSNSSTDATSDDSSEDSSEDSTLPEYA